METTKLSSKGQIVLPKAIRQSRRWPPGTEFLVENTPRGILLRPRKPFGSTEPAEVIAALEAFFGLATVQVEDEAVVARALASARAGMDVADALHVAGTPAEAEAFLTFDRSLIRTRPKVPRVQIVP